MCVGVARRVQAYSTHAWTHVIVPPLPTSPRDLDLWSQATCARSSDATLLASISFLTQKKTSRMSLLKTLHISRIFVRYESELKPLSQEQALLVLQYQLGRKYNKRKLCNANTDKPYFIDRRRGGRLSATPAGAARPGSKDQPHEDASRHGQREVRKG